MGKQKQKGTAFESWVADYLSKATGDEITRRPMEGKNDKGDIRGFRIRGKRTVLECKNCKKLEFSKWLAEAEAEKAHDGAEYGIVIAKRPGCGQLNMGRQYAVMDLETLAAIAVGGFELLEEF